VFWCLNISNVIASIAIMSGSGWRNRDDRPSSDDRRARARDTPRERSPPRRHVEADWAPRGDSLVAGIPARYLPSPNDPYAIQTSVPLPPAHPRDEPPYAPSSHARPRDHAPPGTTSAPPMRSGAPHARPPPPIDEDRRKLFVGGLAMSTAEATLKAEFSHCPNLVAGT
jgi:hypothetical protein